MTDLREFLDMEQLSKLLELFCDASRIACFIVDFEGNMLYRAGLKGICAEFHAKQKVSSERCLKHATVLIRRLKEKCQYTIHHRCNGLVDAATPLLIGWVRTANIFV